LTGVSERLDPACEALGITADLLEPGHAVLRMTVTEAMINQHGSTHGGYLFLLADAAFAWAVNVGQPASVAMAAEVTFCRPAFVGDDLRAEARRRSVYGRNGVHDVTVTDARTGDVVAEFRGHSMMVGRVSRTQEKEAT
jgi:acyl-CoA thioesterase